MCSFCSFVSRFFFLLGYVEILFLFSFMFVFFLSHVDSVYTFFMIYLSIYSSFYSVLLFYMFSLFCSVVRYLGRVEKADFLHTLTSLSLIPSFPSIAALFPACLQWHLLFLPSALFSPPPHDWRVALLFRLTAEYAATLTSYTVTSPMRVSSDGAFINHHLHHTHNPSRSKRDALSSDHEVHYLVTLDGKEHQVINVLRGLSLSLFTFFYFYFLGPGISYLLNFVIQLLTTLVLSWISSYFRFFLCIV